MVLKRIICLASSRKYAGRCIAGKEPATDGGGAWVRPVSARPTEEVSEAERRLQMGGEPGVLDIIDVPLLDARPRSYQTENWLLDPARRWRRVGRASWTDLAALADEPPVLWDNGSSTALGLNDRVPLARAPRLSGSLHLLRLTDVKLQVFAPRANLGDARRRVQASFVHRGVPYRIWVTDPVAEKKYLAGPDGEVQIGDCFATVSLGEPHEDGYCYKLLAGLIIPQPEPTWRLLRLFRSWWASLGLTLPV